MRGLFETMDAPTPKFRRNQEDFACARCGAAVRGDGYTNHCPACLWSMHVDVNPGDRANPCRGMMEPVWAERKGTGHIVYHRCQKCGGARRVKSAANDSPEAVLAALCRPVAEDFLKTAGRHFR